MVLLVEKLRISLKFPSKLNNHHPKSEAALSASLRAFRLNISNLLNEIVLNSEPGSDFVSLERVPRFIKLLWSINYAFASLVVCIDYPMSKWEAESIEEYLNYSLNCLELLNCVSSCLSRLSHDRLKLSHGLSLAHAGNSQNLKRIQPKDPGKQFKLDGLTGSEERHRSGNERIIHQALLVKKSVSLWIFGIIISSLCSDVKPYNEMKKLAARFDDSLLKIIDSKAGKEIIMKHHQGEVKEVREVNEAIDAKELKTRLEMLEKSLQVLERETNDLFAEMLASRNKLMENIRFNSWKSID